MKTLSAFLLLFVLAITCNAQKLDGKWKGTLNSPNGDLELTFTFKTAGDSLTGTVTSEMGTMPIENGKVNGNEFSFEVNVNGRIFENSCVLEGDSVKLTLPGTQPMMLSRVKETSKIDGKWLTKVEGPQGETELTFTFKVIGDTLTGSNSSSMGEFELKNGKVNGNEFSFDVDLGGMIISHKCKYLDDDSIDMKANVNEQEMDMKLTRINQ